MNLENRKAGEREDRPTPETNAATFYSDTGGWVVAVAKSKTLENERDEARDELKRIDAALGYDKAWSNCKTLSEAVMILKRQRDELESLAELMSADVAHNFSAALGKQFTPKRGAELLDAYRDRLTNSVA